MNTIKHIVRLILQSIIDIAYLVPLKKKEVIIGNAYGSLTGHLKALDFILTKNKIKHYTVNNNQLKKNSFRVFWILLRTKSIVYTHNPEDIFIVIPKRVRKINIWHGMPYKPIGYRSTIEINWIERKGHSNQSPYEKNDFLIVNDIFWVDIFYESWQIDRAKIYPFGSIIHEYVYSLSLKSEKSFNTNIKILYAPTFRNNGQDFVIINSLKESILKYQKRNIELLIKLHPKLGTTSDSEKDIFEEFIDSDILITDYSSVMYEFISLGKPCILYQPDKEEYEILNGKLPLISVENLIQIKDPNELYELLDLVVIEKHKGIPPSNFLTNDFLKLICWDA